MTDNFALEQEVQIWRQITGLNVTAVRHTPALNGPSVTIDGVSVTQSDCVELEIDGKRTAASDNKGVYTVTTNQAGWAFG